MLLALEAGWGGPFVHVNEDSKVYMDGPMSLRVCSDVVLGRC